MKLNTFPAVLAILTAALITYLLYALADYSTDTTKIIVMCITGFIFMLIILLGAIGISYPDRKVSINIRALSTVCLILLFIIYLPMAVLLYDIAFLIVPASIVILIYLGVAYSIINHYN